MKKIILYWLVAIGLFGCTQTQNPANSSFDLDAKAFSALIAENPSVQILDVRTPGEFEGGHIKNAINIDWNADGFDEKIKDLDSKKPVLVYCLSGARSAEAAQALRTKGFEQVYDLRSGMLAWRGANLPEEQGAAVEASKSMSLAEYQALMKSDKLVLVDFYADWCVPCKQMEPYLNKIGANMKDKVTLLRIDVDKNAALAQALKIEALPVLKLYKADQLVWDNLGFVEEATVLAKLAAN